MLSRAAKGPAIALTARRDVARMALEKYMMRVCFFGDVFLLVLERVCWLLSVQGNRLKVVQRRYISRKYESRRQEIIVKKKTGKMVKNNETG